MKLTLLQMVQSILSDMDGEGVNSLTDTEEAGQIASIIQDTYYNIVSNRLIPEHKKLVRLISVSDSTRPTHMKYGEDVTKIERVWYNTSKDTIHTNYEEIKWTDPLEFIRMADGLGANYYEVDEAGTTLRVGTNKMPSYYTSFDDEHIVFDSYDSAVNSTITEARSRAYGVHIPVFDLYNDNYVPDIDANMFPYLLAESKSVAFSLLHGGSDPKVEQAARRQKSHIQNDKYNTIQYRKLSNYGR